MDSRDALAKELSTYGRIGVRRLDIEYARYHARRLLDPRIPARRVAAGIESWLTCQETGPTDFFVRMDLSKIARRINQIAA